MQPVTVKELVEQEVLALRVIAGSIANAREIRVPRIQKPGLALTGYEEQLSMHRLLTLGGTEIAFLDQADDEDRRLAVDTVMNSEPACIVITRGLSPPEELRNACQAQGVPLIVSTLVSSAFIGRARHFLQEKLSPATSLHGVLIDVLGVGILIIGKSGIGKSEAALDLIVRGHRLVADDIVDIRRIGPNLVYGEGSGIIRHHMEIRGLGIINIKDLFGIAAVKEQKKIEMVIEMEEWADNQEYERLGIDDKSYDILGDELPWVKIPIRPGRNVATIIEVAARNQLLKQMGHNSAIAFQHELTAAIARATPSQANTESVD